MDNVVKRSRYLINLSGENTSIFVSQQADKDYPKWEIIVPASFGYYLCYNKGMRLDKFLKVSRLIKRRTVANEACDAGRVLVNGKTAKASLNVKNGDVLEIQFGNKTVKAEILDVKDTAKKDEAKELFRYL